MTGCPLPESELATLEEQGVVLVVDDDVDMAEVLCHRLQNLGYRTVSAKQGRQGIELARELRPHLILLDVRLPDMSGLEVCEELTDSAETCDIPVMILSGMERPDMVRRVRRAGGQYFLRKPYDPNALLVLMRHVLDGREGWSGAQLS